MNKNNEPWSSTAACAKRMALPGGYLQVPALSAEGGAFDLHLEKGTHKLAYDGVRSVYRDGGPGEET